MNKDIDFFLNRFYKNKNKTFPGILPVALTRDKLTDIFIQNGTCKEYVVSYKADGERFLWLCFYINNKPVSILVNRNLDIQVLPLHLPSNCFDGCILDLELIEIENKKILLLFDSVALMGKSIINEHYGFRLECMRWFLHLLSTQDCYRLSVLNDNIADYPHTYQNIQLQFKSHCKNDYVINIKPVYCISNISKLPTANFSVDGLIFQCTTNNTCFKWKPPKELTIDFLVYQPETKEPISTYYKDIPNKYTILNGNLGLYSINNNNNHLFSYVQCASEYEGRVCECYFNTDKWLIKQIRTDKIIPNSNHVVCHTIKVIQEDITLNEIKFQNN